MTALCRNLTPKGAFWYETSHRRFRQHGQAPRPADQGHRRTPFRSSAWTPPRAAASRPRTWVWRTPPMRRSPRPLPPSTRDAALVCTAPLSHAAVIGELLDNDLPVFTELNLVSGRLRREHGKGRRQKPAAVSLLAPCCTAARRSTSNSQVHGIWQAGALYLPHRAVSARLASLGELQKLLCRQRPHRRRAARFSASTCPGCSMPSAMCESVTVQKDTISDLGPRPTPTA